MTSPSFRTRRTNCSRSLSASPTAHNIPRVIGTIASQFKASRISKVFSLAVVLGRSGDKLWKRVGKEPSGKSFNSIALLESENGRPRNPFINAGALVVVHEILSGRSQQTVLMEMLQFVRAAVQDDDIPIDQSVARSEAAHGERNHSLAYFLKSLSNLRNDPDIVLPTYFNLCAISMTTDQLARAGRFLMEGPASAGLLLRVRARQIKSLMLTCGHYDGSGNFAFRVGIPAKSGVGGGILAIVPGRASIAVFSPGLDVYGNSLLGTKALETLSNRHGWTVLGDGEVV